MMLLKLIRSVVQSFYDMKLRHKLMLSYFILISLTLGVLSTVIFNISSAAIRSRVAFSTEQSFNQTCSFLSYKMYKIIAVSDILAVDSTLSSIINKDLSNYENIEQIEDMRTIQTFLKSFQDEHDIYRIRLYVHDGLLYSEGNANIGNFTRAKETYWGKKLMESNTKVLCLPYQYISGSESNSAEVLSIARVMKNQNNYLQIAGMIRVDIEKQGIVDILKDADSTTDSITYLVNSSGIVVAASNEANLKSFKIEDRQMPELPSGEGLKETRINSRNVLLMKTLIQGTDWTMVTIVPYSSFMHEINQLGKLVMALAIGTGLLAFMLAYLISFTVTKRISALSTRMKEAQTGSLAAITGDSHKDEVGVLFDSYNFMIYRIKQLIGKQYEMGKELKSAELKALQSQINPHFLYNTLDMINWLSYQNKLTEINSVVSSLASFYKLTLNKGRDMVTINDEIKHAGCYLKIQDIRFGGQISFLLDVDPVLLQYAIPKITLQPIVENAIHHGILEKESKRGTVSIRGHMYGEDIIICVQDDGVGIPGDKFGDLTDAEAPSGGGSRYGLRNINQRIKLIYGEQYGLAFRTPENGGTEVEIRLSAVHLNEVATEG